MGILKAVFTSVSGAAADQWKECFVSGGIPSDMLMTRAVRMTGAHSANNGDENVISDGSTVIVGEGECAVATENGKLLAIHATPGENAFTSEKSSGIFGTAGIGGFAKDVWRRVGYGGDAALIHRLYYINTRESRPIDFSIRNAPFRWKDENTGLDIDGMVSCSGMFTIKITDPEKFYRVAVRFPKAVPLSMLAPALEKEFSSSMLPVLSMLAEEGIRPNALPSHTPALCEKLADTISDTWFGLRGISVVSIAISEISASDKSMLQTAQRDAALRDPTTAAATLTASLADAMRGSAKKQAENIFLSAQKSDWLCTCGQSNSGKFCTECGRKRP